MPDLADVELHPGAEVALRRHEMDESEVARAIAAGDLTSPQKYGNGYLFNLRITGTGAAYRQALKEYVWRDPSLYLNQNFLDRCQGLPVIIEHPDKMMLDTKEFSNRVVGMIVYPYLKQEEQEVWGIARILDQRAAKYMQEHQLSTSPAVVFRNSDEVNEREELGDGKHLLIEGKPSLLDHLAICEEGVWDKGGPPTGVDSTGVATMAADDDRKRDDRRDDDDDRRHDDDDDDRARRDAETGEQLDKILTGLDSLGKRMDALEARHGRKDDDDDDDDDKRRDRKDARKRDDDDDDDDDKRRDRKDEGETDERHAEELRELAQEEEEEAKEDKRKDRKDARQRDDDDDRRDDEDEDEEEGHVPHEEAERKEGESDSRYSRRMDAAAKKHGAARWLKRDDESVAAHCDRVARDMRRDRARRDAEESAEKAKEEAEEAKADAQAARNEVKEVRRLLDEMRTSFADRQPEDEAAFADMQHRADTVYMALGDRAPAAMRGETLIGYRSRLARGLQSHSKAWKDEDLSKLSRHSPSAFEAAESAIYADAQAASLEPTVHAGAGLRKIVRRREGGGEMYEWAGDPLAWMADFMPPASYAVRLGKEN